MNAVYGLPNEGAREEDSLQGLSNSCYSIPMAGKANNGSAAKRRQAELERQSQNSYQVLEGVKQLKYELFKNSLEHQNSKVFFREASGSRYPNTTSGDSATQKLLKFKE